MVVIEEVIVVENRRLRMSVRQLRMSAERWPRMDIRWLRMSTIHLTLKSTIAQVAKRKAMITKNEFGHLRADCLKLHWKDEHCRSRTEDGNIHI